MKSETVEVETNLFNPVLNNTKWMGEIKVSHLNRTKHSKINIEMYKKCTKETILERVMTIIKSDI